ncbi:MAG: Crp/Fnr family transcriptional regulator [Blastocatellales bacterium]
MISFFPQGTLLFIEGQDPKGVFVLCSGRAKLTISSGNGKSLMRVAEAGEILGLGATISGRPYEVSAEMMDGGQVNFIKRENFLEFLRRDVDVSLRMAQLLSREYFKVHEQVRTLALTESVSEKLAKQLLEWCKSGGRETEQGIQIKISLTHGEIAQMIGTSRETVTRLLGELKSKGIIQLKGSTLYIQNKTGLESLVNH